MARSEAVRMPWRIRGAVENIEPKGCRIGVQPLTCRRDGGRARVVFVDLSGWQAV
jgi:hypothetical protein